jgi:type IV secretory pathway VirB4 component
MNKYIHITQEITDYHKYAHNLELYNSKPSVAGCIFYNKLPNNIKQIENKKPVYKGIEKLLIKGCYYLTEDHLNEEFSNIGY